MERRQRSYANNIQNQFHALNINNLIHNNNDSAMSDKSNMGDEERQDSELSSGFGSDIVNPPSDTMETDSSSVVNTLLSLYVIF